MGPMAAKAEAANSSLILSTQGIRSANNSSVAQDTYNRRVISAIHTLFTFLSGQIIEVKINRGA